MIAQYKNRRNAPFILFLLQQEVPKIVPTVPLGVILMGERTQSDHQVGGDKYVLPRNEVERERLENQHVYQTDVLGGRLIVSKSVRLTPGARVLDAGTGSASWILALSKEVPESVELVGTDNSTAMFPKDVPSNLKLYEMSTTDLPADWSSTFDFVNQRMLMTAFTLEQWQTALSELFRVLKPGGAIQLIEIGPCGLLDESRSIPATERVNELGRTVMHKGGLLGADCRQQLPGLLKGAGFSDVQVETFQQPLGRQWGETGVKGSRVWNALFRIMAPAFLDRASPGTFTSRADVDELIERAKNEWDETPGVFREMYVFTAEKAPQQAA